MVQVGTGYGAIPRSEHVLRKRHLVLTALGVTMCCALVVATVLLASNTAREEQQTQELAAKSSAATTPGLPTYADKQKALQAIAKITRQIAKLGAKKKKLKRELD